jgi:hypothetical protein
MGYLLILIPLLGIPALFIGGLFLCAWAHSEGMGLGIGFLAMDCPGFWENFPKDDDEVEYAALAGIQTDFFTGLPRRVEFVTGKRAAYIMARRLAHEVEYKEKCRNPRMSAYEDGSYPNSVGVYWALQKKNDYLA